MGKNLKRGMLAAGVVAIAASVACEKPAPPAPPPPEVYVTAKDGLIDGDDVITDEKVRASVGKYIDAFDAWMTRLSPD